jgi:hypothetical protein
VAVHGDATNVPDCSYEGEKIIQPRPDDLLNRRKIYHFIGMNEDVVKACHRLHRSRELARNPPVALQAVEKLAIGPRLAQTLIGDDVGGDVEHRLNCDLERVLDKTLLPDILVNLLGPG